MPVGAAIVSSVIAQLAWKNIACWEIKERKKKRVKLGLDETSTVQDTEVGQQVRYHNSAIYKDIRFFIQVTLAIVAGSAAILCADCVWLSGPVRNAVLIAVGALEMVVGIVLFLSTASHQASKIAWWWREPERQEIARWQETWVVPILVGSAVGLAVLIPMLPRF